MPKRETVNRDIVVDGVTYPCSCTQMQATRSLRLAPRLGRVVAPMLSQMRGVKSLKGLINADRDVSELGPALEAMFAQLDDAAVDKISTELLSGTTIQVTGDDGTVRAIDLINPAMIDMAFQGDLSLMMAVLKFAAEVNFGRYFFGRAPSAKGTPTPSE